jgi:myo-inositol-1(or 4)-monophosphatase
MKRADLELALRVSRDAAREAAALLSTGFRRKVVVEHKGKTDLVTKFDRDSETLVRARLAAALPHAIIGEEEGGTWDESEPTIFVDPLDGTTNFVHGHPFWCVSIGLVENGLPVMGVVLAPMLGLEFAGWMAGDGERSATRWAASVPESCAVSAVDRFEDSLLATGFPYDRSGPDNNFDAFVAIKKRCQAVRRCGSAALDLCLVADGTYDGYWERKLNPWDLAGGAAIVRASGGQITDFAGQPRCVTPGNVVATNGVIHDTLLAELDRVHSGRAS